MELMQTSSHQLGPQFCSMKITQDVRDYADKMNVEAARALELGLEQKSKEFLEKGAQIYLPE